MFSSSSPTTAETATAVQAAASLGDLGGATTQGGSAGATDQRPLAAAIVTPGTYAFTGEDKVGGNAFQTSVLEYQPSTGRFVSVPGGNPSALAPPPSITYNGGAKSFALNLGGLATVSVRFDPSSGTFQSLPAGETQIELSFHPHQQVIVQTEPDGLQTTLAYDPLTQTYFKLPPNPSDANARGNARTKGGGSASSSSGGQSSAAPNQASATPTAGANG